LSHIQPHSATFSHNLTLSATIRQRDLTFMGIDEKREGVDYKVGRTFHGQRLKEKLVPKRKKREKPKEIIETQGRKE